MYLLLDLPYLRAKSLETSDYEAIAPIVKISEPIPRPWVNGEDGWYFDVKVKGYKAERRKFSCGVNYASIGKIHHEILSMVALEIKEGLYPRYLLFKQEQ